MCGEHHVTDVIQDGKWGSSPHVRGTLGRPWWPCRCAGIIPACAGNTPRCTSGAPARWDHPHMCGEHQGVDGDFARLPGSSPHVRGTPRARRVFMAWLGIIPACAGNTLVFLGNVRSHGDHPHMCGEHFRGFLLPKGGLGSSPHVRGTPRTDRREWRTMGIIPACAGNTLAFASRIGSWWDHPRMCGEHGFFRTIVIEHRGSSPHVRGTPERFGHRPEPTGIIPACAGNTIWDGEVRR